MCCCEVGQSMRVAVLSRSFIQSGGGAESYSVAVVAELAQRHDIHVFAQETDEPVAGVHYHRVACISSKPRWLNQLLFAVLTWWKTRSGFDVVHSHENTWHGQVQTIHVRTVHHNLFRSQAGWRKWLKWLQIASSPRLLTYVLLEKGRFRNVVDRQIVAASEILQKECQRIFVNSSRVQWATVAPGVALPAQWMDTLHARAALGLPADVSMILFVANDYARKGLDTVLQALSQMDANVHLAVAGHTGQKAHYQRLAVQAGLGARVHFLGSLADLAPAYFSANVLAHPTREDSYGMVVLEAMAHRLPVVVSGAAYCGIANELRHHENALILSNPYDASEVADALQSALRLNDLTLKQLQSKALEFAMSHSWRVAASRYEVLYEQAVSCNKA